MDSQKHQSPNKTTKHDDMLRQAIYNTGANVFVVLAGFGIVALYWVLESFFRPLMWAMLCGAFLHPFKCGVTKNVKSWLDSLKHSHTPFALGVLIAPFKIVDSCSESLVRSIQQRWRVIVLVLLVFTTLYVTYLQAPMDFKQFTACVWNTFSLLSDLISLFSFKWVFALIVGYLFMVVKYWSSENKKILSYLAFPIWIVTILCIISDAGALRLPLAFVVLMLIAIGAYTDYCSSQSSRRNSVTTTDAVHHDKSEPPISETIRSDDCEPDEHSLSAQWSNISNALFSSFSSSLIGPSGSSSEHLEVSVATNISEISNLISDEEKKPSHRDESLADISQTEAIEEVSSSPREESVNQPSESQNEENVSQTNTSPVRKKSTRRRSDKCFIFLFWAIILVILWSNVRLILLPFISIIFLLLKQILIYIKKWLSEDCVLLGREDLKQIKDWLSERFEVVVPSPIRAVVELLLKGDNKLIDILLQSADTFITVIFILLMFVGFVVISILVCTQVHKEGIHLVTVTSNLVQNSTFIPTCFSDYLPTAVSNETGLHSSLDPMIKNLYSFGREWIKGQLSDRISHEPSRKLIENELMNIWDALYQSWVTKNTTLIAKPNYNGALFSHIKKGGVDFMWNSISVNLSGVLNFVRENIGLFQSVVESVWILLKGNINLAMTSLLTLLQLLLGGGTAILNSILSLVVFFTTLFYLLASSSNDYKPVEWITTLTIAQSGSKFAQAVEDGIGGVFMATLKMAAFYGLYTWLTHTVFGINFVFLPSVLAAILGAIPFVGTYWAALPAVLELCLIHKEVFLGVLLAVFHVLPTFVVDAALYSDIKGGGHPYLTGLAIAGGIYCFGLQGAIVGPVLLCCIIVAMNLYSAMINPDHSANLITSGKKSASKGKLSGKTNKSFSITRSLSAFQM